MAARERPPGGRRLLVSGSGESRSPCRSPDGGLARPDQPKRFWRDAPVERLLRRQTTHGVGVHHTAWHQGPGNGHRSQHDRDPSKQLRRVTPLRHRSVTDTTTKHAPGGSGPRARDACSRVVTSKFSCDLLCCIAHALGQSPQRCRPCSPIPQPRPPFLPNACRLRRNA